MDNLITCRIIRKEAPKLVGLTHRHKGMCVCVCVCVCVYVCVFVFLHVCVYSHTPSLNWRRGRASCR